MSIYTGYTSQQALVDLKCCTTCPRLCKADRTVGPAGYCKTDAGFYISSICIHKGEEPAISGPKGICNVFFSHCNLQCIFCQNYQISDNRSAFDNHSDLGTIVNLIIKYLDEGCASVGFVSASHMVPQMVMIINELHERGRFPYIVYNSNGYDKVDTLKRLEGMVDVYLPDFKYSDSNLGKSYSDAKDYFTVAGKALKEMYRQMGSSLITDRNEIAARGMIIRHLVLPGQVDNSKKALDFLAEELSTKLTISLMSQYHPVATVKNHPDLGRTVSFEEYEIIKNYMEELGFINGWVQELESNMEYLPDFTLDHPFESNISCI